ncbi:hypothetical protein N658DRAFT_147785 [Parathielavia hyrcaniae]|uniref:Uncharacterized protein n=1 Tax=Parathielavia hyrcaniae TaxID=113614 RepID=A0AAN6T0T3_9PEZI|nr:hypothetical protein N658DRAFT_147785 [Parathielavia hyrcaniae]
MYGYPVVGSSASTNPPGEHPPPSPFNMAHSDNDTRLPSRWPSTRNNTISAHHKCLGSAPHGDSSNGQRQASAFLSLANTEAPWDPKTRRAHKQLFSPDQPPPPLLPLVHNSPVEAAQEKRLTKQGPHKIQKTNEESSHTNTFAQPTEPYRPV